MKLLFPLIFFISVSSFAGEVIPIKEVFSPEGTFPESSYWKVATIQWNPSTSSQINWNAEQAEAFKKSNRAEMEKRVIIAAQAKAKFIILPEFSVVGYPDIPELPDEEDNYRSRDDIKNLVETVPGVSTQYFSALAKKLKVWIQYGFAEKDPVSDYYYNSVVVLNPKGELVASYRKQHLFELEGNYLEAGTQNVTFQTPAGKVGLIICSDSYDSHVLDGYKAAGVKILSLSTSWARMNSGMSSFKSTARQTSTYVLAANQGYFPDTGVVNPDGTTQSHIRQTRDGIAYGFLPKVKK